MEVGEGRLKRKEGSGGGRGGGVGGGVGGGGRGGRERDFLPPMEIMEQTERLQHTASENGKPRKVPAEGSTRHARVLSSINFLR